MTKYLRNRHLVQQDIRREVEFKPTEPVMFRLKGLGIFQACEIHTGKLNIYEKNGDIWINGHYVYGWIEEKYLCEKCGLNLIYDADYDSQFCPECNIWLYHGCEEQSCSCCSTRPSRPLPIWVR